MIQPSPNTASWYLIIGVSLVCFPWFFWFLTILYRIVSRACGFRMICCGPSGDDHLNVDIPLGGPTINNGGNNGGVLSIPIHDANTAATNGVGVNFVIESGNGNEVGRTSGVEVQPGSPKRVHFGGVVVLGEEDGGDHRDEENPKPMSSPSSSSSSSPSPPRNSTESEMPLRLFMAS
ncbi:uncharacterized protein LOC130828398 [Amaranthus tricolor]|uniref:uncharacterized protein LOC130828398 n=1 Tax=Amaranthus tricolor TaxID=29722 RepID=UPI002587D1E9|nr:uncharacterized protein LOC130828398 [Amaranthus tricolor]